MAVVTVHRFGAKWLGAARRRPQGRSVSVTPAGLGSRYSNPFGIRFRTFSSGSVRLDPQNLH